MHRSILFLVACGFLVGCHFEGDDDEFDDEACGCEDVPPRPSTGGRSATGGARSTHASGGGSSGAGCGGEGSGSAGSGGEGAGGEASPGSGTGGAPPLAPCTREADCEAGFNCDLQRSVCTPSDTETCSELTTEDACDDRTDCKLVYAGVNCSCGPGCECVGGEPGCICASFEFFRCEPAE